MDSCCIMHGSVEKCIQSSDGVEEGKKPFEKSNVGRRKYCNGYCSTRIVTL